MWELSNLSSKTAVDTGAALLLRVVPSAHHCACQGRHHAAVLRFTSALMSTSQHMLHERSGIPMCRIRCSGRLLRSYSRTLLYVAQRCPSS